MTTTIPADVQNILATYSANCREDLGRTEPQEITRDAWQAALEILPPDHHERRGPFEAFQCIERRTGRLTATYLRRGSRCWSFTDVAGVGIDYIIERVRRHLADASREAA